MLLPPPVDAIPRPRPPSSALRRQSASDGKQPARSPAPPLAPAVRVSQRAKPSVPWWRLSLARLVDGTFIAALVCAGFKLTGTPVGVLELLFSPPVRVVGAALGACGLGFLLAVLAGRFGSPGLWLAGVRWVDKSGAPLSRNRILLRALFSVVSAVCCGAGHFWTVVDRRGRAWHDRVTGAVPVPR